MRGGNPTRTLNLNCVRLGAERRVFSSLGAEFNRPGPTRNKLTPLHTKISTHGTLLSPYLWTLALDKGPLTSPMVLKVHRTHTATLSKKYIFSPTGNFISATTDSSVTNLVRNKSKHRRTYSPHRCSGIVNFQDFPTMSY